MIRVDMISNRETSAVGQGSRFSHQELGLDQYQSQRREGQKVCTSHKFWLSDRLVR